jgi:hypothetical protein
MVLPMTMEPRPRTLTDEDIQTTWTRVVSADRKVIGIYVPHPDRSNHLDVGDLFPGDDRDWGDVADGLDHGY